MTRKERRETFTIPYEVISRYEAMFNLNIEETRLLDKHELKEFAKSGTEEKRPSSIRQHA